MKALLLVGIVCLGALAVSGTRPMVLFDLIEQLYPSDAARRRALSRCFVENRTFDRLDPAAREGCYRRSPMVQATSAAQSNQLANRPEAAPQNFVDLWRAAGAGAVPQNDVRAEQQTERFLRSAAPAGPR